MNIAFVAHNVNDFGGHSRYAAELVRHFYHDNDVSVFASTVSCIDGNKIAFYKIPSIKWPVICKIISFFISSYIVLLYNTIRKKYDLIHLQGACTMPTQRAVVTAHICSAAYYNIYKMCIFPKLSPFRKCYQHIYIKLCIFLEKMVFSNKNTKKIIAPSQKVRDELFKHYKVDLEKIVVLYEGVDIEKFKPRQTITDSVKEKNLFLVGDYERNNLFSVLKALKGIGGIRLYAIGDYRFKYYKGKASALGIENRIKFLGRIEQIHHIFKECDIFICPSIYESFGLAALEAMACGIPVLVSKHSGISELIEDSKNGLLLDDPTDATEITDKIKTLLKDSRLMACMAKESRKLAIAHTWDSVCNKTFDIYKEIVDGS